MKLGLTVGGIAVVAAGTTVGITSRAAADGPPTATPIKHVVVIFQENISFDHYFGTYPNAANPAGEPAFHAAADTPSVNNLESAGLLTNNPNVSNPQRFDRSEQVTCDENHDYTAEQLAMDHGVADAFVQNTGALTRSACDSSAGTTPPSGLSPNDYGVLDYYDGNTVTGLWNYAQHFAMSDNSFSTTYGPSTPGALNVISGQTYGVQCSQDSGDYSSISGGDPNAYPASTPKCPGTGISTTGGNTGTALGTGTMISDADAYYDVCSNKNSTAAMGGPNVGSELSSAGISWGWFEGGFQNQGYVPGQPATSTVATKGCTSKHYNILAGALDGQVCTSGTGCQGDYSAHHEPFQYYQSTSNPTHAAPSSIAAIGGNGDGANHQYDLADFWAAVDNGNMPAVSYLKAARFQDGHPHNSDPEDEQQFIVSTINKLQKTKDWKSTAVVIAYDDSDGWYDHVLAPVVMQSQTPTSPPSGFEALDQLTGNGLCGSNPKRVPTTSTGTLEQARCGYGMRQPLLVISPYAKENFVDHSTTDQSSVVKFIEDNWLHGERIGNGAADAFAGTLNTMFDFSNNGNDKLFLDPVTGEVAANENSD
ncbi:MAG TPA: alkaline phosphatase family protein [Candidatus Dormibacteraeota bacterium]